MFEFSDIPKFFIAFFLVMPLISILHESGHVFFAWLMGGKNIKVSIGTGKPVFNWGMIEIRKYYFWYGLCTFENLKRNQRWSNLLIFAGGSIFNILGVLAIIILIKQGLIDQNMFTYQFTYFSFYYLFFALIPMPYPNGNFSDGKVILDLLRGNHAIVIEKTFTVKWDVGKKQWQVLNNEKKLVQAFENEEGAYKKAREIAKLSMPSRIIYIKEDEEKEIYNFPKIPL